jgi:hypothetical protein
MRGSILVAICGVLVLGCVAEPEVGKASEIDEIVGNLVQAGYRPDDITIHQNVVYVGRDAVVTLQASREMLEVDSSSEEAYRTSLIVQPNLKICFRFASVSGPQIFRTALSMAIENYNALSLSLSFWNWESTYPCDVVIVIYVNSGTGGSSGFPSGGLPFGEIYLGSGLAVYGVDTVEHVIKHEIGHTIGLRHADYFNRSISCGVGANEGSAGVGAIHIPGTPTGATVGGSVMNSCFRSIETGEFSAADVTALNVLYGPQPVPW